MFVPAHKKYVEGLNSHSEYNKNTLILNLLVDFLNLTWVSSNPSGYGFRIIKFGGSIVTREMICQELAQNSESEKIEIKECVENILKDKAAFVRALYRSEVEYLNKHHIIEIHRVADQDNCHVFLIDQESSSSIKSHKTKIQPTYYSQSSKDYQIRAMIIEFGFNRFLLKRTSRKVLSY